MRDIPLRRPLLARLDSPLEPDISIFFVCMTFQLVKVLVPLGFSQVRHGGTIPIVLGAEVRRTTRSKAIILLDKLIFLSF